MVIEKLRSKIGISVALLSGSLLFTIACSRLESHNQSSDQPAPGVKTPGPVKSISSGGPEVTPAGGGGPAPSPHHDPAPTPAPAPESALCSADYKADSCAFKFDEGGTLRAESQPDIEAVFFGKKLDLSKLRPTFKSSALSIYQFAQSQGVDIHTTKRGCGCDMFSQLSEAPKGARKYWDDVEGGGDSLLGLFVPLAKLLKLVPEQQPSKPMLMLRADTDKWTLVHEYTHFLFDAQRLTERTMDADSMVELYKKSMSEFALLGQDVLGGDDGMQIKPERMLDYVKAYLKFANTALDLHTNFTLEEVTVEGFLSKQYQAGAFSEVTAYARQGAADYLSAKARDFNQAVEFLRDGQAPNEMSGNKDKIFASLEEVLEQIGNPADGPTSEAKSQLLRFQDRISKMQSELAQIESQFGPTPEFVAQKSVLTLQHRGCSHEDQGSILKIKNIRSVFKNNYRFNFKKTSKVF